MKRTNNKKHIKIMRRDEVEYVTGLSRSSIYLKMQEDLFPSPVKLGERSVGWIESEVQEWISEKLKIRDTGEIS